MAKSDRIKKDGRPLKPGYELKVNDEIEIAFGNRVMRIRVTDTSNQPQYDIISEIKL
jgi:ribosomal 50S subunit-recycling heat shock protein